jgi:hypothetical protein
MISAQAIRSAVDVSKGRKITPVAVNRRVHSCWTDGKTLTLIFDDCMEMVIDWGNVSAELRGRKVLNSLPQAPILEGPVSRILAGKTVAYCYLDDVDELVIRTKCGHEAVIGYESGPVIRRMDVKVEAPGVSLFGVSG